MTTSNNFAFLHGGGQGGWVWSDTITALQQQSEGHARVLALDVPGCGAKRGKATESLGVDDIAVELLADLVAAGMKDVVLVGHSQAGTILPRMVEQQPDLFRRLIYVSCSAPLPGQNIWQQMGSGRQGSNPDEVGWPFDPGTVDPRVRPRLMFCNDMNAAEASKFAAQLGRDMWPAQSMTTSDWRYDHLGLVPSSYVICLRDAALPPSWQETFATRLKVERLSRVDAGHQVMNTRPQALAEIIRHEAEAI